MTVPRGSGAWWRGRLRAAVIAKLLLVVTATAAVAQSNRERAFREYLTARAELGHFNGSVLVADDGKVIFGGAFGLADREHGVQATTATRYRIASITKQFTAAAVLLLQDDGLLSVDDPVSAYIDDLPTAWSTITIHQLLRHTSGIPDYEEWFGGYTTTEYSDYMSQRGAPARIIADAADKPLEFTPGSEFRYSNTNYVLLGYLIERVSGTRYGEFLRERIFQPAGMPNTVHDDSTIILENRAIGYTLAPGSFSGPFWNGMQNTDFRNANYQYMQPPLGDSGLVSTTSDLYRWSEGLANGDILSPEALRAMFTPGLGDYGYGWYIGQGPHGLEHRHTGGLPGFACEIVRFPDTEATIIVLSNVQSLPGWIVRDLTAILFGTPYTLPRARSVVAYDDDMHGGYEGVYRTAGGDSLRIYVEDLPVLDWPGHFTAGLFPESSTQFYAALIEGEVRFTRSHDGAVGLLVKDRFGEPLARATRVSRDSRPPD